MPKSPPSPPSSCPLLRENAYWLLFFSNLKILIKKTCLYFYEPTDDLFFQAKKHSVLDLSINISWLNKLCWSLYGKIYMAKFSFNLILSITNIRQINHKTSRYFILKHFDVIIEFYPIFYLFSFILIKNKVKTMLNIFYT